MPIFGDEKIFWKVNFQRFFAYLRDQELIQAFTNRIDQVQMIVTRVRRQQISIQIFGAC